MKILIKMFLILGIPIGLFVGILLNNTKNAPANIYISFGFGITFSFLIIIISFFIHIVQSRRINIKYGNGGNIYEIKHVKIVNLRLPLKDAYSQVSSMLMQSKIFSGSDWVLTEKK